MTQPRGAGRPDHLYSGIEEISSEFEAAEPNGIQRKKNHLVHYRLVAGPDGCDWRESSSITQSTPFSINSQSLFGLTSQFINPAKLHVEIT